jgi:hypothetical protein
MLQRFITAFNRRNFIDQPASAHDQSPESKDLAISYSTIE